MVEVAAVTVFGGTVLAGAFAAFGLGGWWPTFFGIIGNTALGWCFFMCRNMLPFSQNFFVHSVQ